MSACLSEQELAQIGVHVPATLAAHLNGCRVCSEKAEGVRALVRLGRRLQDTSVLSDDQKQHHRDAVLAAVAPSRSNTRRGFQGAFAIGVAGVVVGFVAALGVGDWLRTSSKVAAGPVLVASTPGDATEAWGLGAGVFELQTAQGLNVRAGPDVLVLGPSTHLQLQVSNTGVQWLQLVGGRVRLAQGNASTELLAEAEWSKTAAQQEWNALELSESSAKRRVSNSSRSKTRGPKPTAVKKSVAAVGEAVWERALSDGRAAFARREYETAMKHLDVGLAVLSDCSTKPHAGCAWQEDLSYWASLSHAKSEQPGRRQRLRTYLRRFADSSRAPEVQAVLGWIYADAGDCKQARPLFRAALTSEVKKVRTSAGFGLEECSP